MNIEPTPAVSPTPAVRPVKSASPVSGHEPLRREADAASVGAMTEGGLRAAYARFTLDPDTQEVAISVHDALTDEVLKEVPSPEVQAMARYLKDYAATLARHRAALRSGSVD
jgi:hypothetical protein